MWRRMGGDWRSQRDEEREHGTVSVVDRRHQMRLQSLERWMELPTVRRLQL
jgi:hypothetical protein